MKVLSHEHSLVPVKEEGNRRYPNRLPDWFLATVRERVAMETDIFMSVAGDAGKLAALRP